MNRTLYDLKLFFLGLLGLTLLWLYLEPLHLSIRTIAN